MYRLSATPFPPSDATKLDGRCESDIRSSISRALTIETERVGGTGRVSFTIAEVRGDRMERCDVSVDQRLRARARSLLDN